MKNQVTGSSDRESRGTNAAGAAGTGLDLFLRGLACSERLLHTGSVLGTRRPGALQAHVSSLI